MTICKGCGAVLQHELPNEVGYTPKVDSLYCQRCFRLKNYGDLMFSAKHAVNSMDILTKARDMDALILWVVDLFDLESALQEAINRYLLGKDIIMISTKRDLLPDSLKADKLGSYLMKRLKENNIWVKGIVVVGNHGLDGKDQILKAVGHYRNNRDVVIVGNTNAGKSTILKNVFNVDEVTISRYPGTTLEYIPISMKGYTLYDTPGFNRQNNIQILMADDNIKAITPSKKIKPITYQLKDDQTLSVGGILRLDLIGCEGVSCVCYFSERLPIHRSKTEKADILWQEQFGKLLKPTVKDEYSTKKRSLPVIGDKFDIVIFGLGWFCISGKVKTISIIGDDQIEVISRKAMI